MQEYGLYLLHFTDNQEKLKAQVERLRLALVSGKPDRAPELFSEFFPDTTPTTSDVESIPEGAAIDYSGVQWMSGEEAMGEYERLMAELENPVVQTTGGEPDDGGEWQ